MKSLLINLYMNSLFLRKFINTYLPNLEPNYLFSSDRHSVVHANPIWADGEMHKTDWYAQITDEPGKLFIEKVAEVTESDDRILDMCCNQGRFLRYLWELGYRKLNGFDIMQPAVELFHQKYADTMPGIDIQLSDAGDYFRASKDNQFDYLITFTATLELVHPKNDIFDHMARIATKGAILMLNEHGHAYPRFWRSGFRRAGFDIVSAEPVGNLTLFVLKK